MGGQDTSAYSGKKEGSAFIEVFSSSGSCDLPDGYPAPLPSARVGHVVASNKQAASSKLFMCGGHTPSSSNVQQVNWYNHQCLALDINSNQWSKLPSLKVGVSYGTAVYIERIGALIVIGGYRGSTKHDFIQVSCKTDQLTKCKGTLSQWSQHLLCVAW